MSPSPTSRALLGVALVSLALVGAATRPAPAQPAPAPRATPAPPMPMATPAPATPVSPFANPTLAPADQAAPIPYPAYGTPAPAVTSGTTSPGVPQIVTLQQAILIAYARSPLLAQARADVAIATAPVALAETGRNPSVTGTAAETKSHVQPGGLINATTGGTGTGTSTTGNPTILTQNTLALTVRQLIYDGGRVSAQIRQARFTQSESVATYQRQLQTIAFNVATAYYNALTAQRQVEVAQATVTLDQVQENLVAAQIRAGTAARSDLATAQFPTAQARVAVVRAQATQLNALSTLANTLGIDADVHVQPKDDVPALSTAQGTLRITPAFPTPTYQTALTRAIALRPDLAAAEFLVNSDQAGVKAARLANFPTLNATGSYGTNSLDAQGGSFRNSSQLGVALTIPIYDQGVTRAQVAAAQGQFDLAHAQLVTEQETVQLGVKQALVNLVSAYAALDQVNAELAQAQTVLRSTQAQYRAGVTTLPLLLNAQVGITTALTDEVNAVYTVRQAEQALLYAEGANAAG
ncbi:MAG TPA: TolC family protein [Candidatus Limnocylindria bacterium]|nr:TolC family protein [Candidatus Limnocylindria bacterium]